MTDFKSRLSEARSKRCQPGSVSALAQQLTILRCETCIALAVVFGKSTAKLYWRYSYNVDRVKTLDRQLAELSTYAVGTFGQGLGLTVSTPCCDVANATLRRKLQLAALGAPPADAVHLRMCHRCDNGLCAAADHLFWGTNEDNVRDMLLKGRGRVKGNVLEALERTWRKWREDHTRKARVALEQVLEVLPSDSPLMSLITREPASPA